jgi:hypothetical protein
VAAAIRASGRIFIISEKGRRKEEAILVQGVISLAAG